MKVTKAEKFQVLNLLPMQGNLKTLALVQQILDKIKIEPKEAKCQDIVDLDFNDEEFGLIDEMIHILDQAQKLNLDSLSLVQKILNRGKK